TRVGEPITLQLTVAGQGNFHGFTLTAPRLPPVLTTFPPTTTDDLSYDAQGLLQGKKTLELILSPKSAGRIELPAVSFPYFDPEQATYQVAQSQPLLLEVDEAKESLAGGRTTTPGSAGAGIALLELPDLRPLRPGGHLLLPGAAAPRPLPEQPSFWLGLALPPLALSCVGLRDRLLQHRRKNEGLQRYRRARRTAARRMEQAAAQRSSPQVFWAEAAAVLHGYLEDRLGQPTRGLTRARLQAVLADEQGYPLPLVDELLDLFDEADLARFAGGPGEMDLGRAGQRTMTMLDRLDRHIPRSPAAAGPELPR
ncbi:MAG: protein BatD, partial [Deltaproteobacteria bacterium]|nr:protein BatD [Deltaproteobacteria bacterium]